MDSHPQRIWLRLHFIKVQEVIGLHKAYFRTSGWVRWCCAWGIAYLGGYVFDWIVRPLVRRYTDLSPDFEVSYLCFSWWASADTPSGQELSYPQWYFVSARCRCYLASMPHSWGGHHSAQWLSYRSLWRSPIQVGNIPKDFTSRLLLAHAYKILYRVG